MAMMKHIISAYRNAKRRLFLLDYDGTLVDIAPRPELAVPTPRLLATLRGLAADERNVVVIISGRDAETLDAWLGNNLAIGLAAEHGVFVKPKGGRWETEVVMTPGWQEPIRRLMQLASRDLTGSFIEEKRTSLVWHYRQADPRRAQRVTEQLLAAVRRRAAKLGVSVLSGKCVIEVRGAAATKADAARRWLGEGVYDFVLAAGDDVTDEDLFAALPATAYCLRIREASAGAGDTLPDPATLLRLLKRFCKVP